MKLALHRFVRVYWVSILLASVLVSSLSPVRASKAQAAPKNIIIMIADGMSRSTIEAASYYRFGEAGRQVYHKFPHQYYMSTYSAAGETLPPVEGDACYGKTGYDPTAAWNSFEYWLECPTDSAAAATAMATGKKTYNGAVGVNLRGRPLATVLERAEDARKATGVVSTMPFSHGTPAAFLAHSLHRDNYLEIAREMIWESRAEVIMGAGHPWYDNNGEPKARANNYKYVGGRDTWDRLASGRAVGADANGDGQPDAWTLIQDRAEFLDLTSGPAPRRVVGVAQAYHTLQEGRSGDLMAAPYEVPLNQTVPTLAEMTLAAFNVLDADPDGFVMMIEGGAVDRAAHDNLPGRTIEEQIDFDRTVEVVVKWVENNSSWDETLLIVTADHETGYITGPDSNLGGAAVWNPIINHGAGTPPGMEFHSLGHTNTLVPFFARGTGAEEFSRLVVGVDPVYGPYIDNTHIAQVVFDLLTRRQTTFAI